LTPREQRVLDLLAEGLANKQIARRLGISDKTVKNHVTAVLAKLGVADRTSAALLAVRGGHESDPFRSS
jgi:DNA-binding NarL/FixJ family response regulator